MKRSSTPLVSSVPATMTTGGPEGSVTARGAGAASVRAELIEATRAVASMRAFGTGCDHRVGGVGLET